MSCRGLGRRGRNPTPFLRPYSPKVRVWTLEVTAPDPAAPVRMRGREREADLYQADWTMGASQERTSPGNTSPCTDRDEGILKRTVVFSVTP